ncbi:hypothetical protein [Halopseudomonas litoralis]|uniref:hypothetical protein n=1 Tax=Halopseudomonas litoralis TaxID=797277 RepID=UPI000B7DD3AA|nr:hypothetical protein [Halopseudomonas litoralis]
MTSNFLASVVGTTVLSVLVLFNWRTPAVTDIGMMIGFGCVTTRGHLLLTHANRFASAATLRPFTYGQIVFAERVGFIAFDQAPDFGVMLGIGMIIASGLGIGYIQGRASAFK